MKIHEVEQGTLDWLRLHIGIPTASGLDNLLDSKFALRTGEMPKTYLFKKVAESWRGQPLVSINNNGGWSTEQGMIVEEEARPFFELETGLSVRRVGFITSDDGRCGCSPDGMISDDCGLEIKSPEPYTHVKYLMGETVPKEYAAQVYGSMFVTGASGWIFMSYRRGFPALIVHAKRDEEIMEKIGAAITRFHEEFDKAMQKLKERAKSAR